MANHLSWKDMISRLLSDCGRSHQPAADDGAEWSQIFREGLDRSERFVNDVLQLNDRDAFVVMQFMQNMLWEAPRKDTVKIRTSGFHVLEALSRRTGQFAFIPEITDLSPPLRELGNGGFGSVHASKRQNGSTVAVKEFKLVDKDKKREERRRKAIHTEILIVWQLSNPLHKNVLPLLGVVGSKTEGYKMVMPFKENGNVLQYARKHDELEPINFIHILLGIISGLEYLHAHNPSFVHGDVKCANVLVNDDGTPCLCDFGISRTKDANKVVSSKPLLQGSSRWMAVELFDPKITQKLDKNTDVDELPPMFSIHSDIWSFGMTALELLSDTQPFVEMSTGNSVVQAIMKSIIPLRPTTQMAVKRGLTPQFYYDLLQKCWRRQPKRRPTVDNIRSTLQRFASQLTQKQNLTGKKHPTFTQRHTQEIAIRPGLLAWFIGTRGVNIERWQRNYDVKIQVSDAGPMGHIDLSGEQDFVEAAIEAIKDEIEAEEILNYRTPIRIVKADVLLRLTPLVETEAVLRTMRRGPHTGDGQEIMFQGHRDIVLAADAILQEIEEEVRALHYMPIPVEKKEQGYFIARWGEMVRKCNGPEDDRVIRDILVMDDVTDKAIIRGHPDFLKAIYAEWRMVRRAFRRVYAVRIAEKWHSRLAGSREVHAIAQASATSIYFPGHDRYKSEETYDGQDVRGYDARDRVQVFGTQEGYEQAQRQLKAFVETLKKLHRSIHVPVARQCLIWPMVADWMKRNRIKTIGVPESMIQETLAWSGLEDLKDGFLFRNAPRFNFQDNRTCPWSLEAQTPERLEEAVQKIQDACSKVAQECWVVALTTTKEYRPKFSGIAGGSHLVRRRIEEDTKTRIKLPEEEDSENCTIEIAGSWDAIWKAISHIQRILRGRPWASPPVTGSI